IFGEYLKHACLANCYHDFQYNLSLSAPSLPARLAPILTDTNFHLTHQKLGKTHTHHFMTLWPDQAPTHSLSLKPRPLWILTVLHFKLNIPLVSLQHGFFYTVTNCEEYTFSPGFAIFGGIRIAACSYIYYYFCQFQVISVTIVGFSFFNGRVPTILSTSVYIYIYIYIYIFILVCV